MDRLTQTPLLRNLTLRGGEGIVTWGWHTAAVFRTWTIGHRERGAWILTGELQRADAMMLKQRPIYFNAPRKGGYSCWPIVTVEIGPHRLVATLGEPEQ
jgi:hypothetical protein